MAGRTAGVFLTESTATTSKPAASRSRSTDTGEAQDFIDKQVANPKSTRSTTSPTKASTTRSTPTTKTRSASSATSSSSATTEAAFEAAVDASQGDSLADSAGLSSDIAPSSPEGSLADVYVDIGGLIKAAGSEVDPSAMKLFEASGVDVENATALLSLVPGSDNVEVDVAGKLGGARTPSRPKTPPRCSARCRRTRSPRSASATLGKNLGEAIDTIDEQGLPGEVPPNQLKETMKKAGIDLDKITANLGDAGRLRRGQDPRDARRRPGDRGQRRDRSPRTRCRTSAPCCAPTGPPA